MAAIVQFVVILVAWWVSTNPKKNHFVFNQVAYAGTPIISFSMNEPYVDNAFTPCVFYLWEPRTYKPCASNVYNPAEYGGCSQALDALVSSQTANGFLVSFRRRLRPPPPAFQYVLHRLCIKMYMCICISELRRHKSYLWLSQCFSLSRELGSVEWPWKS
jgi:hypothetical protein